MERIEQFYSEIGNMEKLTGDIYVQTEDWEEESTEMQVVVQTLAEYLSVRHFETTHQRLFKEYKVKSNTYNSMKLATNTIRND